MVATAPDPTPEQPPCHRSQQPAGSRYGLDEKPARPPHELLEARRRLEHEIARALRYGRPLAVVAVDLGTAPCGRGDAIAVALGGALRETDVAGWDGGSEILVVLPETSESARVPAARVLGALAPFVSGAKAGLSWCPEDGASAEALLAGAREAARCAAPGHAASLSEAVRSHPLAGRSAVVVDPKMKRLFGLIERLSASDVPVLVSGETGAGKEIAAAALHAWSPRRNGPTVAINCAALPESLLESELFGYERGAFTGATTAKAGHLEAASGGTVFLDEIGECSPTAQAKLLRVLETKRITKVGSSLERPIDVRIVAASNRSLEDEVAAGRFRQDLLFRLGAATVVVPPLRERLLDIPLLARTFLGAARTHLGRSALSISPRAMRCLEVYPWPGNVRELHHAMGYVAATVDSGPVEPADLPDRVAAVPTPRVVCPQAAEGPAPRAFRNIYDEIRDLERTRIVEALEATGGVRVEAASLIGMPLRTFTTKLKEYAITVDPGRRRR